MPYFQKKVTVSSHTQIVAESPTRHGLFLQNNDDAEIIQIHKRGETLVKAGIHLYPHCWLLLEKDDDPDKEWMGGCYITSGSASLTVCEFYPKPRGWIW